MLRSLSSIAVLTLVWGINWPVMKLGVSTLPPLWFRSLGMLLGTALLGAFLVARGVSLRVPRGAWGRLVRLALPNVTVWYVLVTLAVTLLPAGRTAILAFTMPAWAAAIGVVFYREPLVGRTLLAVACALASVVLLVAADWAAFVAHPFGVAFALSAAFSWALGTHWLKRSDLAIDTLALTWWMMAITFPVMLALSVAFERAAWRWPTAAEWLPIGYNATLVLALGNVLWFTVARSLPPTLAGLSSMLIPVVGVFSGMLLLHEWPAPQDLAALALVCAAVALPWLPRRAAATAAVRA